MIVANAMQTVSHPSTNRTLFKWIFNAVVLIFTTSTIAQPFVIPSGSMESTLMTGDHVIVDKLAYSPRDSFAAKILPYSEIKRGDIIVFRWPVDLTQTYVKRVIAMPNDKIRIANKVVYRNGVELSESYVQHIDARLLPYRDNFPDVSIPAEVAPQARRMLAENVRDGEVVVPDGNYFAMGDNRDNSSDSRFWGFVPRENIIGKPVIVYWSYEASTDDLTGYSLHHVFDVATHFFTKTRWNRTFRLTRAE